MTMVFVALDHLNTCPKCKILIRDLIQAHFLNGATSRPTAIFFRTYDPIKPGNLWTEGPMPIAPSFRTEPKFVSATPQVHIPSQGRTVFVGKMRASRKQVFESTSYFMQYLFTRMGYEFTPPLLSSITAQFNKEVLETAQRILGQK